MKLQAFHLFYLLTIILILFGFLTNDFLIAFETSTGEPEIGFWSFFLPMTIFSLVTAFLYHQWYNSNRPIHKRKIIFHFTLIIVGLFMSFLLYFSLTLFGVTNYLGGYEDRLTPEAKSLDLNIPLPLLVTGPLLLIAALVYFIVLLATTKQTIKS